jgi:hypothetical protein
MSERLLSVEKRTTLNAAKKEQETPYTFTVSPKKTRNFGKFFKLKQR